MSGKVQPWDSYENSNKSKVKTIKDFKNFAINDDDGSNHGFDINSTNVDYEDGHVGDTVNIIRS